MDEHKIVIGIQFERPSVFKLQEAWIFIETQLSYLQFPKFYGGYSYIILSSTNFTFIELLTFYQGFVHSDWMYIQYVLLSSVIK